MRALQNVREKIKQKGLRRVFNTLWERHVFYHWELLWMERDLVSAVPPHNLKPYPSARLARITEDNAVAFSRYFGDRVQTMAELAREGHTGHMYLDDAGDAVAFIWGNHQEGILHVETHGVCCPQRTHQHQVRACHGRSTIGT
ncbi:hypothetical protein G3436_16385 [Pseudomonas sp. MAFF212427]|uniref:Uncharacterized protein n=2 Tax=Pseudomonas brassicae TaxID=2708063 RepID=A0A6B3NPR1_9PSED|nr:hypothetical protein [Pseudomonas brassicae]